MGSFVLLSFKARFVIANLRACRLKVASIAFSDSRCVGIEWSGGCLTGCAAICAHVRFGDVVSFRRVVAGRGKRVVVEEGISCWRGHVSDFLDLVSSRAWYSGQPE
jgi:hypothetical protein